LYGRIVLINGEHYALRYRDPGILAPEDRGLWRAIKVKRGIFGDWTPADDEDYLITDDLKIVAIEYGWNLRRESL